MHCKSNWGRRLSRSAYRVRSSDFGFASQYIDTAKQFPGFLVRAKHEKLELVGIPEQGTYTLITSQEVFSHHALVEHDCPQVKLFRCRLLSVFIFSLHYSVCS